MSSIPPHSVSSIAQAPLTQAQRAAESDAPREADRRRARIQDRRRAQSSEFVEDMAAAAGLKVQADGRPPERRKRQSQPPPEEQDSVDLASPADGDETAPSEPARAGDDRTRSSALLAEPGNAAHASPPPYLLDVEA